MYEHVRVCRECGEEYRPEIVRCADCGGELEDVYPGREEPKAPPPEPPAEAEPASRHALVQTSQARDLVPLAERLREKGIECWLAEMPVTAKGAPPRYALLVSPGDARVALETVSELVAPEAGRDEVHAVETRFDAERGYLQCPACGAPPPAGALECPECGLGLGGGEPAEEPRE